MKRPTCYKGVSIYYLYSTYFHRAGISILALSLALLTFTLATPSRASDSPPEGITVQMPGFRQAADSGQRLYRRGLAQYSQGHHQRAAQLWRLLAEDGNRDAQFALGELYANGDVRAGIIQNLATAAEWYRRAAEQGHVTAQYNLGVFYASGTGVPYSMHKAARWWRLAALQGHTQAQFNLGLLYAQGKGVESNAAEAVRWWGMAAEQGYAPAEFNLGLMYIMGDGVKASRTQALRLWQLSAKQGFGQAIHALRVLEAQQ